MAAGLRPTAAAVAVGGTDVLAAFGVAVGGVVARDVAVGETLTVAIWLLVVGAEALLDPLAAVVEPVEVGAELEAAVDGSLDDIVEALALCAGTAALAPAVGLALPWTAVEADEAPLDWLTPDPPVVPTDPVGDADPTLAATVGTIPAPAALDGGAAT